MTELVKVVVINCMLTLIIITSVICCCSLVAGLSSSSVRRPIYCNTTYKNYQTSDDFRDGAYLSRCLWRRRFMDRYILDRQHEHHTNTELELYRMSFIREVQALILRSDCTAGGRAINFTWGSELGYPHDSPWLMDGYQAYRVNYKPSWESAEYKEEEDKSWEHPMADTKVHITKLLKRMRADLIYEVYTLKALANDICGEDMNGGLEIHLNKYSDRTCKELATDPSADMCRLRDGQSSSTDIC